MDNPQHSLDDALVEKASEAVYDFLHERFPDGALPGGKQLFADDHLDAEFKHEAGCEELARAALEAAGVAELREENERREMALAQFHAIMDLTAEEGFTPEVEQAFMDLRAALTNQGKAQG